MKHVKSVVLLGVFLTAVPTLAQVQCPYLLNPDLAISYVDSCAQFWESAWDDDQGGFYSNIDRYGNVITNWGTNKHIISQTRNAYGLVRAFMLTGEVAYLQQAEDALDWMADHAWDDTYGGWYGNLNEDGSPENINENKSAFNQHYGLLGPVAYYEATRSSDAWDVIQQGWDNLEAVYWDDREGLEGYYDASSRTGSGAWDKSFNATVDAITTHVMYLYLLTGDSLYLHRMNAMADQIETHLVGSMDEQAIGFAEEYDSDWNIDTGETMTIMGHVLKAAWCLGRVYRITGNESLLTPAETLYREVWDNGYDHDFGGPYKDYNRLTGEMLMWGNPDTAKAWWQMEQAITAGLMLHEPLADNDLLTMADESARFFMQYFVDHEYGDVYENRTRRGEETWGLNKGGSGKAGYHSIETGYYIYLYGNLFLQHRPVTLYYEFETADTARTLKMTPLAIQDNYLRIGAVTHDGEEYTAFTADNRELTLEAGTGGLFTITYEPTEVVVASSGNAQIPNMPTLHPAWPNPFNASTTIRFSLPRSVQVEVKVYDRLGREAAILCDRPFAAGEHLVAFHGEELSSGIYFVRMNTPYHTSVQRLVLVK